MKNLFLLPTNKSSKIYLNQHNTLKLVNPNDTVWIGISQHLYITNDEPMTAGDWYYFIVGNSIGKFTKNDSPRLHLMDCRKIVMTNDIKYIKKGIQPIPDEFLQWYVSNQRCNEIQVIHEPKNYFNPEDGWEYTIMNLI